MSHKVTLTFTEISHRLKSLHFPDVDWIVGISTGGIVPAAMLAHQLAKPFTLLHINYRAEDNSPRHKEPILLGDLPHFNTKQRILLVDDVSVSGCTLSFAAAKLSEHHITSLVLKGKADYVVFPEVEACVNWPWKLESRELPIS